MAKGLTKDIRSRRGHWYPSMKHISLRIALTTALIFGALTPTNTSAANLECPTTWTERLPALEIKSYKGTAKGIPYQVWDNNLGLYEVLNKNVVTTNFNISAPELKQKLDSYGKDIVYKQIFESSPDRNFKKINQLRSPYLSFTEHYLLMNGVSNGDFLRLSLFVEVNGCPPVTIYSNSVQLNGFLDNVVDIDTFLTSVGTDTNGSINFKSKEIFKNDFSALILDLTKSVPLGTTIAVKRISNPDDDFYPQIFIKPMSNDGCLSPEPAPGWGRTNQVKVISSPCKFGVYGYLSVLNPELMGPMRNAVGSYGRGITSIYTLPLLGVYEIKAPTPTPSVTSMPTPTTKPVETAKKTTITCVKGKLTKKVTAAKPTCPSGYKKK